LCCGSVVVVLLVIVVLSLTVGLWWNFSVYLVGEKIVCGENLLGEGLLSMFLSVYLVAKVLFGTSWLGLVGRIVVY
jgi:hypothetical protein